MADLDLSADRVVARPAHVLSGRAVDVELSADLAEGDVVLPKPIGMKRIKEAWVALPLGGTEDEPSIETDLITGVIIRFVGV